MPRYEFLPSSAHGGVWGKIMAWWLLPAHLIWSTVVAAIYLYLNGKSFPYASWDIDQSDIITIMSTLLLVSRLLITSWTPLCAWRCALILLEKTGVQLLDINHILSTKFLLPFGKNRFSREHFLCAFILLLIWPSQLSNPVASGSIRWFTSDEVGKPQSTNISTGGWESGIFDWFLEHRVQRELIIKTAVGRAAMAYHVADVAHNTSAAPIQRISPAFQLSRYSRIEKVSAPAIFLDGAEWVDGPLPEPIEKALRITTSSYLNVTSPYSPLLVGNVLGNCAILKDWPGLGNDTTWTGTQYAALLVGAAQGNSTQCKIPFKDQSGRTFKYLLHTGSFGCFKVLKMNVAAGVRTCETNWETASPRLLCQVSYPSVVTQYGDSQASFSRQDISGDGFLPSVFALMPEVMQALVMMVGQFNNGDTMNAYVFNNPDLYLKSMITSSYQGIWSTLQDGYSNGKLDEITYYPFIDGQLKAVVAKWRVFLWWLLNALITLSGALLFWLQSGCTRDPVTDWVTTGKPLVPFQTPLPAPPVAMTNDHSFPSRYHFCPGETSPKWFSRVECGEAR